MYATGIGESTIYRLVKQKEFPEPIRLTKPAISVWLSDDIQRWIKQTSRRASVVGLGKSDQQNTEASDDVP